jgi:hypothetical protein
VQHPDEVLRRFTPNAVQVQVILGSLLGGGALVGAPGRRRLRVRHVRERADYVRWKRDRLGPLVGVEAFENPAVVGFDTIAHPLFDDLAGLFPSVTDGRKLVRRDSVLRLLTPLGLAVWLTDVGRLELHFASFTKAQREAALLASGPSRYWGN